LKVLNTFEKHQIICSPSKSKFFQQEVEFLGHILRDGVRTPVPGKLLPLQKWALPQTVTQLRKFLGTTNYFSEYVPNYAAMAAPLMGKLKLSREDGEKGSKKPIEWDDQAIRASRNLNEKWRIAWGCGNHTLTSRS
jgi:hypothetical protein